MTNNDLSNLVKETIKKSGYKKIYIADKLGITQQALSHLLCKKTFSIDDANKILNIIGYEIDYIAIKNLN